MPTTTTTTTTHDLPTPDELALVGEKLGIYASGLDEIRSALRAAKGDDLTVAEYERLRAAGEPIPEPPSLDADRLAHLIAFAQDMIADTDWLAAETQQLRDDALSCYHEATERPSPEFIDAQIAELRERLAYLERRNAAAKGAGDA